MNNTSQQTLSVGSFVAVNYRTAAVFQKHGIDFCCKGGKSINEVCDNKKIPVDDLLLELNSVLNQSAEQGKDYQAWPLDKLADHIEKKHHSYVTEAIPALQQFLDKLCRVHGGNHPELFAIKEEFNAAACELTLHMKKEERILFPFIRKMAAASHNNEPYIAPAFDTIENPINMMMAEHDIEGERFRTIAKLSNDYTAPDDGCTTYRVAFSLLKEFEEDLHLHIHLENNILFPRAILLEKSVSEKLS
jgi:regulator of cell morphogenesis and NO signaling